MTLNNEIKTIIEHTFKEIMKEQTEVNKRILNFIDSQNKMNEEQVKINDLQNKALKDIQESIEGVVVLYNGSSKFFKTSMVIAQWIGTISVAVVAMWVFIKFVILTAINK